MGTDAGGGAGWWRKGLGVGLAVWFVFTVLSVVDSPGSVARLVRDDVGYPLVVAFATYASFRAYRRGPVERRRFWLVMAGANASWFAAEAYWAGAGTLGVMVETPSPGDGFLLLSYVLRLAAVGLAFAALGSAAVWRGHLDGAVVCLAVGIAGWHLLVAPQVQGGLTAASATLALYPLLDVALAVLVLSAGLAGRTSVPRPVLAIVAGAGIALAGDTFLAVAGANGWAVYDGLIACLFLPCALLVCLGALADARAGSGRGGHPDEARPVTIDLGVLPTLLAVGPVAVWALTDAEQGSVGLGPFVVLVCLLLALAGRVQLSNRAAAGAMRELDVALSEQRRLATTDGLTGLYNRRCGEQSLGILVEHAVGSAGPASRDHSRQDGQLIVVILDLDHFKAINDQYGHGVGDVVLRSVANRLARAVRPGDVVARWGGEEFLAAMPHVPAADIADLLERLREAVSFQPLDTGQGPLRVTASLGAVRVPRDATTTADALRLADALLYSAKASGRDRVALAHAV